MSSELSPLTISVLKSAGPLFFIGLQAASAKTALKILSDRNIGSFSSFPFVSLLTNCIIWTLYGILKVDYTILLPNALGIIVGFGCITAYESVAVNRPNSKLHIGALCIIILAIMIAMVGDTVMLGSLGCCLAVILMGSPLATLGVVFREKSTASLPVPTSLANFGNALSWSLYGVLVAHDPMVYGPNLIGLTLCSFQIFLYFVYGFPPASQSGSEVEVAKF